MPSDKLLNMRPPFCLSMNNIIKFHDVHHLFGAPNLAPGDTWTSIHFFCAQLATPLFICNSAPRSCIGITLETWTYFSSTISQSFSSVRRCCGTRLNKYITCCLYRLYQGIFMSFRDANQIMLTTCTTTLAAIDLPCL